MEYVHGADLAAQLRPGSSRALVAVAVRRSAIVEAAAAGLEHDEQPPLRHPGPPADARHDVRREAADRRPLQERRRGARLLVRRASRPPAQRDARLLAVRARRHRAAPRHEGRHRASRHPARRLRRNPHHDQEARQAPRLGRRAHEEHQERDALPRDCRREGPVSSTPTPRCSCRQPCSTSSAPRRHVRRRCRRLASSSGAEPGSSRDRYKIPIAAGGKWP